jgi:hypothetical protein
MPRREYTTEIKDDYGETHVYTLIQHPADEGFEILTQLMKIFGPSVGSIAESIQGSSEGGVNILDSNIDVSKLGGAIASFSDAIVSAGGVDFCKRLLKHTTRVDSEGTEQKVSVHFSKIYQGNYAEMGQAVWFSVEKNFVPSLSARSEGGSITDRIASLARLSG